MEIAPETRPHEGPTTSNALTPRLRQRQRQRQRRCHCRTNTARRRAQLVDDSVSATSPSSSEGTGPTPPCDAVIKYMALLLALLPLKYQGKGDQSLFEGNPVPVWSFIAAICVYCFTVEAMKQMPTLDGKCFQIFRRAAIASGVLSSVSLLSIFVPYDVSFVPLIMWTLLPVVLAWPILYHAYSLLYLIIANVVEKIHAKVVYWARAGKITEQAFPPV